MSTTSIPVDFLNCRQSIMNSCAQNPAAASKVNNNYRGRPAMPVLFLHGGIKWVSSPAGRHDAPIKVKFVTGERTTGPLPHAKFYVYRGRNVGIQPQSCQNFEFWSLIYSSGATRLYVSIGSF